MCSAHTSRPAELGETGGIPSMTNVAPLRLVFLLSFHELQLPKKLQAQANMHARY